MDADISRIAEEISEKSDLINRLRDEVAKVLVGQKEVLDRMLCALLANGHVLLEGLPGLAKTTLIKTLAAAAGVSFRRIQFTPDLLPADLIGTQVYNPKSGDFSVKKGPVFANFILADEINRAPAKVQSALLEVMQEYQVTIGGEAFSIEPPFLVMATQNPIEQEGTYPLPEAQVDRFMLKVVIGYPDKEDEKRIIDLNTRQQPRPVQKVADAKTILECQDLIRRIYVDEKILDYIVEISSATRTPAGYDSKLAGLVDYGASPRAAICLNLAARAQAFLAGRGYVTPQDVKSTAVDVLRHRVLVSYEAEAEGVSSDDIIKTLLNKIPVP